MAVSVNTRISLSRDAMVSALGLLTRTIERRNTLAILANVLVDVKGGLCRLTASDLDIWATTSIALSDALAPDAATTLPAQMLSDIVRKLPSGAEMDLSWGDKEAQIASGRARYRLNTLPPTDYPSLSEPDWLATFSVGAKALRTLFEKVSFAMSNEEVRYYLNGAFLHTVVDDAGDPHLVAVATDGHRLSKVTMPAPDGSGKMPGVIVPRKAVGEIVRLLDGRDGDIEVSVSDAKLSVTAGPTRLLTKLIEGSFPDYARVIPQGGSRAAVIDADALSAAADRVSTVSGERGKAVRLSFAGTSLKLEVKNPDAGDAEEEVQAEFEGEPLEIGFNARYLAEALRAVAADTIRIQLGDPGSPAVMTSAASADHLVVVMPMRV
ncbi:DNA polymerase III subunit beta [uncultured Pleomorphomonas sp.]|uniref:Beta sliding clamp n=1 Tax=uncultured Pleomorphomonas sp. TaxID=442121 RepID=A0A212L823_9HYPH|nr:DNA polymerase III subunit beta [uncultured Pleomorphomonas sp.]SCM73479.1 DNA polymerase III subunit beta [uncultured Pleomorphomonas sp.]